MTKPIDQLTSTTVIFDGADLQSDKLVEARDLELCQWQPIETAPKDETEFIGFINNELVKVHEVTRGIAEGMGIELGEYHTGFDIKILFWYDDRWCDEDYADCIDDGELCLHGHIIEGGLTHWMPLPKPPKESNNV